MRCLQTRPTAAITVNVDVPINLGSDADTLIEETSSNDTEFTIADRWIITSDSSVTTEPIITTVIYGPGTPTVAPLSVTNTVCSDINTNPEGIGFSYVITVPANASRSLMFFAGLGDIQGTNNTINGAIVNVAMFNNNASIDTRLLDDLSTTDQQEILNWDFSTTISTTATAAEDDEDRTFIDDFFGCSLGKRKANDPTFLLLVLLAMGGLFRNRVFRA